MLQEQTPQNPTDMGPEDAGSLDAAALAFEKREQVEAEADTEEAEVENETQDDDPDAEASDGDSDEDTDAAEELVETEFEGKTYKVPPELQKALLRQADYSRNMNKVAEKEKVYTQRVEQAEKLIEGAGKYAQVLAEMQVIDGQLKRLEGVNWQQLRQENPAEYAAIAADVQSLRLARQQAEGKAQSIGSEVEQGKSKVFAEKRNEMDAALRKDLKGWGNEMGEKVTRYAVDNGVQEETLRSLTDPAIVIALEKARKFDVLQASKAELKARPKDAAPVLKPGAKKPPQDASSDAMTQLRKFKTRDAAEVAFLARMR